MFYILHTKLAFISKKKIRNKTTNVVVGGGGSVLFV